MIGPIFSDYHISEKLGGGRMVALILLLATALSPNAEAQTGSKAATGSNTAEAPEYRVTFEHRDPVAGITASSVVKLPFMCAPDGTVFVTFVGNTVPADVGLPPPPPVLPPLRLVSISPAGNGQSFDLSQVTDLYISSEVDHYVSESEVVFVVKAASEYKPQKKTYSITGGGQGEYTVNAAEQREFLFIFDRDGSYRQTIKLEDLPLHIENLGVFLSGVFLAYGYDPKDHKPELEMLKEDGTPLRPLQLSTDDVPQSVIGKAAGAPPGVMAITQLVAEDRSIFVVQSGGNFPLLEVSEGGAIRAIRPKLPKDSRIKALIPSDSNLYAVVEQPAEGSDSETTIYELSREDGSVLRRFELSDRRRPSEIACVHDQKFLSLDHGDGKLIPVIGSAEPVNTADQQNTGAKK